MPEIIDVIYAINQNGRQGPRDLKSAEVFSWVRARVDISYETYISLLEKHSISAQERLNRRDAFFIRDANGRYGLFKSTEGELHDYVCAVVYQHPGIPSNDIIRRVKLIYPGYTYIDLMDQQNLSSPQQVIDQTIRNILTSNYNKRSNFSLLSRSEEKPFTYTLKEEGVRRALAFLPVLAARKKETPASPENAAASPDAPYTPEELARIREKNRHFSLNGRAAVSLGIKYPTDPRLRKTRMAEVSYRCELHPEHTTFPTPFQPNYLEGHHMIPMAAQKAFPRLNLDCIENIIALCPTCHAALHYGTKEVKRELFSEMTALRRGDLSRLGFSEQTLTEIFESYYEG